MDFLQPLSDRLLGSADPARTIDPFNWTYSTHAPLNLTEATEKLREEESIEVSGCQKIRTHIVQVASQQPVEDRFTCEAIKVESQEWPYWGVFDGHSGWATAEILRNVLGPYLARELSGLDASDVHNHVHVRAAVEKVFCTLDDKILSDGLKAIDGSLSHAEAMCRMAPSSSGSCATTVFLDPVTKTLHVACVGDSRAVLGRKSDETGKAWTAEPLSEDQTGFNKDEIERIEQEHPGETPVSDGRVLNCAVTRSFGDNRWKWPLKDLETWRDYYFGRNTLSNYHTPPYLTAKPVVTSTQIKAGDFLILASDGFWSHVSSEDAVHCASMWLRRESGAKTDQKTPALPAEEASKRTSGYPYDFIMDRADFIVNDENAATHLARNAFGGRNEDLFCSLLSTKAPDSKEARDDLTVIVVLF
ncbi:unnamed protein product [Clonostachys rosea]|uniref:PPM-type phosphatase domain-containing protein n=1 Tax=Bionectria ochroleuca TaxID=29856 RepID=A0ABY6V670_BIOOC|nr:unnamed protein product [Clonostachys rosea]